MKVKKRKNRSIKRNLLVTFIILSILIGGIFVFSGLQQSALGDVVYIPTYGSMKCSSTGTQLLYEKTGLTSPITVTCGVDMNYYTNYCKFSINFYKESWYNFDPKLKVEACNNKNECQEITGTKWVSGYLDVHDVFLDINRDGYINDLDSGAIATLKLTPGGNWVTSSKFDVKVVGNAYFLEDNMPNGYGTTYKEGCNLLQIDSSAHVIKKEFTAFNYQQSSSQVPFDRKIYYIFGLTPVITSNVITHNNKLVYIEKAGYYCNIKLSDDKIKYADCSSPITDNTIQCVPSVVFLCNADATLRKTPGQDVSGQECSIIRGVPFGTFLRKSETDCCMFNCVDNKLTSYNCEKCEDCEEGYVYDNSDNSCKKAGSTGTGITGQPFNWKDYLPLIIGGIIGFFVLLIIVFVVANPKSQPIPYIPYPAQGVQ